MSVGGSCCSHWIVSNRRHLYNHRGNVRYYCHTVSDICVGTAGVGRCCDPHGMAHCILALHRSIIVCKVATLSHSKTWMLHACAIAYTAKHTLMCMMMSHFEYLLQNVRLCPAHWASSTCHPDRHEMRCGRHWRDCRWEEVLALCNHYYAYHKSKGCILPFLLYHGSLDSLPGRAIKVRKYGWIIWLINLVIPMRRYDMTVLISDNHSNKFH
jgi:hypothetical protein